MKYEISLVPTDQIVRISEAVEKYIDRLPEQTRGRFTSESIIKSLYEDHRQLWIAFNDQDEIKGIIISRIVIYPECRKLRMIYCSGDDMANWKAQMQTMLERFAIDNGCNGLEMTGRKGWTRFLADLGWETTYISYEKNGCKKALVL